MCYDLDNAEALDPKPTDREETHAAHVARVPLRFWQHAKRNAVASNMTFREYVIRLLEQSKPVETVNGTRAISGQVKHGS